MKNRTRLRRRNVEAVANKYGLKANAGYWNIAHAICAKTKIKYPQTRDEAKQLIACQPEYGKPAKQKQKRPRRLDHVASDAFLESYEWRRVRMVALKKHGSRCQCCGATPSDGLKMNVDHIKPRKLFPELALDVDNLQVLCEVCNHGKGNWDQTDWRPKPAAANDAEAMAHIRSIVEGR